MQKKSCKTKRNLQHLHAWYPQGNELIFVKKFKVYSTTERSSLFDLPRTLCVVHIYTKQLFVGMRYLELIDCACSLRSLGVVCVCTVAFLYSYSKMLDKGWKLLDHCTSTSETEQNDMKSSSRCFELRKKMKKAILVSSDSVCKLPLFVHLDRQSKCKITRKTRWWRLEDLKRLQILQCIMTSLL